MESLQESLKLSLNSKLQPYGWMDKVSYWVLRKLFGVEDNADVMMSILIQCAINNKEDLIKNVLNNFKQEPEVWDTITTEWLPKYLGHTIPDARDMSTEELADYLRSIKNPSTRKWLKYAAPDAISSK